jgi:prepilin-type N-terminal cleavage/methylation domain-containing protein
VTTRRDGFTLIEVLVALVILGFVIVGIQAVITDRMVRDVDWQEKRARATHLAMDRLHAIQADPDYAALSTRYVASERDPAGSRGFTRTTAVAVTPLDRGESYTTITVTVAAPGLSRAVSRTLVVASP